MGLCLHRNALADQPVEPRGQISLPPVHNVAPIAPNKRGPVLSQDDVLNRRRSTPFPRRGLIERSRRQQPREQLGGGRVPFRCELLGQLIGLALPGRMRLSEP